MREKKLLLYLVSLVAVVIIVLSKYTFNSNANSRLRRSTSVNSRTQDEAPTVTGTKPTITLQGSLAAFNLSGNATQTAVYSRSTENTTPTLSVQQTLRELHTPVVHVRHTLSLSYHDQITCAAGRVQSHQCWAAKMASKIVEPFVVDTSYFGGLTSEMDASSALRLGDLFDLDHWNQRSLENNLPPLITWEEFLQTATRQVILVRNNNWGQLVGNEAFRCEERDFEKLRAFWTRFLEPHGFQIFKKVCVHPKKRSDFTKVLVTQGSDINVTVIIDYWREVIGTRGPSLPYMVTDSTCDQYFRGTPDVSWLKPSPKIENDSDLYISKYLNTDHKYIAVMLRWEIALYEKHMNGARCMPKILESMQRMQQQKNLSLIFMATDSGNLGSDIMARLTRPSYIPIGSRKEGLKHTEELLQTVFDPPVSLAEYEHQFEVLQIKNPAYVSIVQKLIAAKAECLLLLPFEGKFQKHALQLYKSLHKTETECTEQIEKC